MNFQSRRLTITSAAAPLYAGVCSTVVTVQSNVANKAKKPSTALTVNLSGTSGLAFYSDDSCQTAITSVTIPTTAATASFYMMPASNGSQVLTVASTSYNPATQNETTVTSPFTWVGSANNNVWTSGANWLGGAPPGVGDMALFDGTCSGAYCSPTLVANLSTGGIQTTSAYAGTITVSSSYTLTLARPFIQSGGTFVGGSGNISIAGSFNLLGGSFTSTSGTLTDNGAAWILKNSPTFNANSGTITLGAGNFTLTPGTATYNNVTLIASNSTITTTGTWNIHGLFNMTRASSNAAQINGGTWACSGNVTFPNGNGSFQGTTVVSIAGSTNQTVNASAIGLATLGYLNIASTGGTVTLLGNFAVSNSYVVQSGTLVAPTSLSMNFVYNGGTFTPGTASYNAVTFYAMNSTIAFSSTLNLTGTLTLQSNNSFTGFFSGGTINAKGDIVVLNYGLYGSATINVNGSSNQTINASGAVTPLQGGEIPNLNIASTGGTVTLTGNVFVAGSYTYTSGTIAAGTSTLTLWPASSGSTFTAGSPTYYNVVIAGNGTSTTSILSSITASNNITFGNGTNSETFNMPSSGGPYSISAGATLLNTANSTLNLHGATHTEATFTNNGTVN